MSHTTKRIAFLGATGGCAGHCLAACLNAGYTCKALARTPAKLTEWLKAKGVSTEALDRHLTIVQGNAKDVEAVKSALTLNGQVVDTIVSGIGAAPKLQWSLTKPVTLNDPSICQDAANTVLSALSQLTLQTSTMPLFIVVSTTGIQPKGCPRDIPVLFIPLYYWLLKDPHEDKMVMESALRQHMQMPEKERQLSGFVLPKPSLLMDGEALGLGKVREGTDERPAVGYTIRRKDVGLWMFERLVSREVPRRWMGKGVSITY